MCGFHIKYQILLAAAHLKPDKREKKEMSLNKREYDRRKKYNHYHHHRRDHDQQSSVFNFIRGDRKRIAPWAGQVTRFVSLKVTNISAIVAIIHVQNWFKKETRGR